MFQTRFMNKGVFLTCVMYTLWNWRDLRHLPGIHLYTNPYVKGLASMRGFSRIISLCLFRIVG